MIWYEFERTLTTAGCIKRSVLDPVCGYAETVGRKISEGSNSVDGFFRKLEGAAQGRNQIICYRGISELCGDVLFL